MGSLRFIRAWPYLVTLLATFLLGLWIGGSLFRNTSQSGGRVLFYQDSMHPWVKSDQPGVCPICSMELTPIYEGAPQPTSNSTLVSLPADAVTVARVSVEPVVRRDVRRTLRVSGIFEAQESRTAVVAAPGEGRVESIAVDHPGTTVHQGDVLARIFSPDLAQRSRFLRIAISNEQAAAVSSRRNAAGTQGISGSAAADNSTPAVGGYRLNLFMSDLVAPMSGIVTERSVTLGQYVMEGEKVATVLDPSVLWFRFDATDSQLSWIRPGQGMNIVTESAPGRTWPGTVSVIEPVYDEIRRASKVRAVVTNAPVHAALDPRPALLPGMIGAGVIQLVLPDVLVVPKSSVVYPGSSAWVYVEHSSGTYERRKVRLGREGDGWWEILHGLAEGERVVTAGNVLIDAQAVIEGADEESALSHYGDEPFPDVRDASREMESSPLVTESLDKAAAETLSKFFVVADRITSALGGDNLEDYNRTLPELTAAADTLVRQAGSPRWKELASAVADTAPKHPARSLEDARAAFLRFGAAAAGLAQHARTQGSWGGLLHIYHCPMAPKPGLWIQAGAPIANPFFGASMLGCGEELDVTAVIGRGMRSDR